MTLYKLFSRRNIDKPMPTNSKRGGYTTRNSKRRDTKKRRDSKRRDTKRRRDTMKRR